MGRHNKRLEEPKRIDIVADQQAFGLLVMPKRHFMGFTTNA
jgi:hypothetical protein